MRKQFVRLFLGFVAVVFLVLSIQVLVFLVSSYQQRNAWTSSVFQEYLDTFTSKLKETVPSENGMFLNIEQLLLSSADDRVSGLYLRNPDGTVAVAYGKTSSGNSLPIPKDQKPDPNRLMYPHGQLVLAQETVDAAGDGFNSVAMRCDVYAVKIINTGSLSTIGVTKQTSNMKQTVLLPPQVKATDIAGSMVIQYNDSVIGSVDVLTFTPFTYKNTARMLKGMLGPFMWSIPLAFILALAMAASISRNSQRYTQGIQESLTLLSKGENGVKLPETKIDEQRIINQSIMQLDENLKQNRKSRQAWLRSISHDLNTPVTSMKLLLDGMNDGVFPLTPKTIQALKKENDDLSDRIAMVVLYANLQSPDTTAVTAMIDIPSFIDQQMQKRTESERKRIYVDWSDAKLDGDPQLLAYALEALLDNALKASGGSVGLAIQTNRILLTNAGTLPEGVDFFEPWTRGDAGRSTAGSGLGLPIVYQVMRLHNGKASIEQTKDGVQVTLQW